jgi:hypothetical protein
VFSGVFIAAYIEGTGDKESEGTIMIDVQTLLEAFLNMSKRYACLIDEAFSQQKAKPPHSPQLPDYQDFQITERQINGILVYYVQRN